MPILGVIDSAKSNWLDASGFFPIATYMAGANVANITFSGIPQTYTHLQLRMNLRNSAINNYATISINSGTYRQHNVFALGASGSFTVNSSTGTDILPSNKSDSSLLFFSSSILDIEDYSSTSRYKTLRGMNASRYDTTNANGYMWLTSMLSVNTSAVTSITITPSSGNFVQFSRATLYGWK